MGSIVKKIRKIIPKEIRPAVPLAAAYFGGPALAAKFSMNPLVAKGITAALASKAQGDDTKTALRSAALSIAPDVLSEGMTAAGRGLGNISPGSEFAQTLVSKGTSLEQALANPAINMTAAKTIGAQAAIEAGAQAAELNEKALRDYEAQLREQGIADSAQRRSQIFGYFSRAGYDDDEVNSFLDKYGYADGGRVKMEGGGLAELIDYLKNLEDEDDGFDVGNLDTAIRGLDTAFGRPTMGAQPQPMGITPGFGNMPRIGRADGGIMNLGGREMDMRGGGFIPIGAKERADDVPARLSKNEFVMTADAVRGAGNGSINKGAKRMYDLMNRLESKV
jgi:hypothetical protein